MCGGSRGPRLGRGGGIALALAVVAVSSATTRYSQENFGLQHVGILSGCWSGRSGDVELREQWTEASGGVILGNTRYLRAGEAVDWEFGRIVADSTGVTLWPYPRGVASPRGFPLVRVGPELVFENLEHDFPVRIIYAVEGPDRLRPRIEGSDGQGPSWVLERVACPAPAPR